MVSVGLCILETIAAVETILNLSEQYAILMDQNRTQIGATVDEHFNDTQVVTASDESIDGPMTAPSFYLATVHHYAHHGLCRNFIGKKKLYQAMKTKLCLTKLSFTADFVIELCKQKHVLLEKWVAELFDIDGDGYITHFEKQLYDMQEMINDGGLMRIDEAHAKTSYEDLHERVYVVKKKDKDFAMKFIIPCQKGSKGSEHGNIAKIIWNWFTKRSR